MMRVMPYRSMNNRIMGVVGTFRNVDAQKKAQERMQEINEELEQTWTLVQGVFDMSRQPMAVLDYRARLVLANPELYRILDLSAEGSEGEDFFHLAWRGLEGSGLQSRLEDALEREEDFQTPLFQLGGKEDGQPLFVQGRIVPQQNRRPYRILLSFQYA